MVLQVEFSSLGEEAKKHHIKPFVYLSHSGSRCIATLADPTLRLVIQGESQLGLEEARKELGDQGLNVSEGRWVPDPLAGELQIQESIWVAAVSYRSTEEKPGLWVHAYRGEPSVGDVIKLFHVEMSHEAGLVNVALEDFLAAAEPNVVVIGPDQMEAFANSSPEC